MISPIPTGNDFSDSKFPNYKTQVEASYLKNPNRDPTTIFTLFDVEEPYSLNLAIKLFGKDKVDAYVANNQRDAMLMVQIPQDKAAVFLSQLPGYEFIAKFHRDNLLAILLVSGEDASWISMPIPS